MPQTNETPAGKAGARGDLLGGWSRDINNPSFLMAQFPDHRAAALALLSRGTGLSRVEAGFLGQIAADPTRLSDKQEAWLCRLLVKQARLAGAD